MFTFKQGMKLSAAIDKLNLKITNAKASQEELGADIIMQIARNAHKAEKELLEFVSAVRGISLEEAADVDMVEFFTDLFSKAGVKDFFKKAVKSRVQG